MLDIYAQRNRCLCSGVRSEPRDDARSKQITGAIRQPPKCTSHDRIGTIPEQLQAFELFPYPDGDQLNARWARTLVASEFVLPYS